MASVDQDEPVLPDDDLAESLGRAEDLLIEAFDVLKSCMPVNLACVIAIQVIEDLASLETSQAQSH